MTSTIKRTLIVTLATALAASCAKQKPPPAKPPVAAAVAAVATPAAPPATPEVQPEPSRPYYPRVDLVPGYVVDPVWPAQRPKVAWGQMAGAAVDGEGNIWTLNRGSIPVQVFSPQGQLIRMWPASKLTSGHQIRIDHAGNVWIADYKGHCIREFDQAGTPLLTIGTPGEAGEDERHFNLPTDIAVAPSGDVFITDGYANNRVVHCDASGKFVAAWGKLGVGEGEFSLPHSIVIDSRGLLYVADRNNNRIQVFDQSGSFLRAWSGQMVPWTLWITPRDELYAIGSSPSRWQAGGEMVGIPPKDQIVVRMTSDFRVLNWWAFPFEPQAAKFKPGVLNWVHAVTVDADGNLFLGDVQGNRIQKFWLAKPTKLGEMPASTQPASTQP